jgi:hypothetical protein
MCVWATGRTIGTLAVSTRDASISELAGIMRRMRPDVEHR